MTTKITPPFRVSETGGIFDRDDRVVLIVPHYLDNADFPKTICRIMNENANALVHAANGEEGAE